MKLTTDRHSGKRRIVSFLARLFFVRGLVAAMLLALLAPAFGQSAYAAAAGALGFSAAELQVAENGGPYYVEVTRTGGTSGTVKVDFAVTDGTAVNGKDYNASRSGTLTFNSGVALKKIYMNPRNNFILDGNRTLTVTLSNPTNGAALGTFATTTVNLTDDERPEAGTVQFGETEKDVYKKGETAFGESVTLTRTPGAPGETTVTLDSENIGSGPSTGYELVTRQVTFAEGETEKRVLLHLFDYNQEYPDRDGSFRIKITDIDGEGVSLGTVGETVVNVISRNATSGGEFVLAPDTTDVYESVGHYDVNISRQSVTNHVYGGVSVDYQVIPVTASGDSDYEPISGTLQFGEDEREKTISVPIVDDSADEGDEMFAIKLSNPTGGAGLGKSSSIDVTIMDNDDAPRAGIIEFDRSVYRTTEPAYDYNFNDKVTEKPLPVTIRRTGGSDAAVTVDLATSDGTARADHEYGSVTETVYFPAGVTTKTVMVPVYTTDSDKTFDVHLSNPTGGASLGTVDAANATIVDMGFEGLKVSFPAPEYTAYEYNGYTDIRFKFNYTPGGFAVDYTVTDETAVNGEDYILPSGTYESGYLDLAGLQPEILNGDAKEPDETFTIKLSNPRNGYHLGDYDTIRVTIKDNGPDASPGDIFIDRNQTSAEENEGELTAYVHRDNDYGWDKNVTVDYATEPTGSGTGYAEAGTDYEPVSGQLVFAPGESVKTVKIPLIDDNLDERTESFGFRLSNPGGGANISLDSEIFQILDTDDLAPAGKFRLPATLAVDESAGTADIEVTRVEGAEGTATVDYATGDGTASAGFDYEATAGTLTFDSGELTKTITVPIDDDTDVESVENFKVALSNPTGGASIFPGAAETEVTITDNDRNGSFSFDTPTYLALEESTPIHMKVLRRGGTDGVATVRYTLVPGTATPGADTDVSGMLTFPAGIDERSFDIPLTDDNIPEGAESFTLKLSDPTGGAKLGSPSQRRITIYDKDGVNAPGSFQVEASKNAYEPDGTVSLKVTRPANSTGAATVDYATEDGTAKAGSDFEAAGGTLTFGPGEWSKTIAIPIIDDNDEESEERFTVVLSNPTGGAGIAEGAGQAVVTIPNNDHHGYVHFDTPVYYALEESGPIRIKVLRSGGFDGSVSVHYSLISVSATPGEDYEDVSGTLVFAQGEGERSFSIAIPDDDMAEGQEKFILKLSDPTGGVRLGSPSSREITLFDKDGIE